MQQYSGRAKLNAFTQVSHPDISALRLFPCKKKNVEITKQACKTVFSLQSAVHPELVTNILQEKKFKRENKLEQLP